MGKYNVEKKHHYIKKAYLMMEKSNNKWYAMDDPALVELLGQFIRNSRIQQNRTQQEVATAAGLDRSTISLLEKGQGGTLKTFIQLLRVLGQLPLLAHFMVQQPISPLLLARQEASQRQRASGKRKKNILPPTQSEW
jgi:transcriptional regulator with XRE-family HTH domain